MKNAQPFKPLQIAVLTISNRHTAATDSSGDLICQLLQQAGHLLLHRSIVPADRYQIRAKLSQLICDAQCQVILLNGGTGFAADNCTIDAITPLFDQAVVGFGELFRQLSYQQMGSASLQSSAMAGLANQRVIFALPGSPDACELAMHALILPQLDATVRPCNFVPHLAGSNSLSCDTRHPPTLKAAL